MVRQLWLARWVFFIFQYQTERKATYKANQVRICVSDSREDEVDDEQVYQDVKEMIDAFQVNGIILSHEFRFEVELMTII